jgi:Cysteine-rich secretory protein family
MRRIVRLLLGAMLVASAVAPLAGASPAHADSYSDSAAFVASINAVRARSGVAPLAVDTRLTALGTWWAGRMAAAGVLGHNLNLGAMMPAGWTLAGENVGVGPSELSLEAAFEHSPEHLANMVDPRFTAIGVGVVWVNGTLWVSEEYMAGVTPIVPQPQWSGWRAPQGTAPPDGIVGAVGVATWGVNRFDQFAQGQHGRLWHRWSVDAGSTFSGWVDQGAPPGGLASTPTAISWGDNRIDVFAKGADKALWHMWWDGAAWSVWRSLGGSLASAPTVASWAGGRLDVFAAGQDHAIWHEAYDGMNWSAWEDRGGIGVYDPAATSWGPGRIDLFTVGQDSGLWHSWYGTNGWSGWFHEIAGTWSSGPGAASWGVGRLDVFLAAGGQNRPITHAWYSNGWGTESLGGVLTAAPAGASWRSGRVDAFVRGTDGNIWQDSLSG